MPAEFRAQTVYLHVRTNGVKLTFYTDSGGACLIKKSVAASAQLASHSVADPQLRASLPPGTLQAQVSAWQPIDVPLLETSPLLVVPEVRQITGWPEQADGILGQAWFAGRVWTWDYVKEQLWLDPPGWHPASKQAHPLAIAFRSDKEGNPVTHFVRVTAQLDGTVLPFLLDTGAETYLTVPAWKQMHDGLPRLRSTSMLVERIVESLHQRHPNWPYIANAQMTTHGAMLRVPDVELAGVHLGPVWFTARPNKNFEQMMSSLTAGTVEGSLGGNALADAALTVDYKRAKAWIVPYH